MMAVQRWQRRRVHRRGHDQASFLTAAHVPGGKPAGTGDIAAVQKLRTVMDGERQYRTRGGN
jgi:hypothetical protein